MADPITLANAVLPGAGYVHVNRPVSVPCRITLSPGTDHAETVPVYLCSDDAVPVVQLGHGSWHGARVVLARAHAAGSPVRVEAGAKILGPGDRDPGRRCPKCDEVLTMQRAPCPDGIDGCGVAHWRLACTPCERRQWETRDRPATIGELNEIGAEVGRLLAAMGLDDD